MQRMLELSEKSRLGTKVVVRRTRRRRNSVSRGLRWGNRKRSRRTSYGRLFYNYYRTYDPSTGRYLEPDPIGLDGGFNTYAYVAANPLSHVDQFGLEITGEWLKKPFVDRIIVWDRLDWDISIGEPRLIPPSMRIYDVTFEKVTAVFAYSILCKDSEDCEKSEWIISDEVEISGPVTVPYRVGILDFARGNAAILNKIIKLVKAGKKALEYKWIYDAYRKIGDPTLICILSKGSGT